MTEAWGLQFKPNHPKLKILGSAIALSVENAFGQVKHPVLFFFNINKAESGKIKGLFYLVSIAEH
jgi:hypothetical protein